MSLPVVPTWCLSIYIRHSTEIGIDSVTDARARRSDNRERRFGALREKSVLCGLGVDNSIAAWSLRDKGHPNASV